MTNTSFVKAALLLALIANSVSAGASVIPSRCEVLFSKSPSAMRRMVGGVNRKIEDWNSDKAFSRLLSANEKNGQVASVLDRKLETEVYYTATGLADANGRVPRIDPEAKAVVVFFHGSGTAQSGGANFVANMNRLANLGYAGMSFDLPFHANGPTRDQFKNVDFFMKWIHEVLRPARESGKPVFLVGHSFGPDVIAEYLYRYPQAVDGAALLSPAGFNPELQAWYDSHTSKMKFGGDVAESTLGGQWAGQIAEGFKWSKSEGVGDPTVANPNLHVEVLSGDREEYVPGPVGGKGKTPIGQNTYDLRAALQPFFKNANIVIEPGIGHYIFTHNDSKGQNVVMRTIYKLLGFDGTKEETVARDISSKNSARPYAVQLAQLMATDSLFQSWLVATEREGLATGLTRASNNVQSEKLIVLYKEAFKARVKAVRY